MVGSGGRRDREDSGVAAGFCAGDTVHWEGQHQGAGFVILSCVGQSDLWGIPVVPKVRSSLRDLGGETSKSKEWPP